MHALILLAALAAGPFSDTFDYPDGADGSPDWFTQSIAWEVSGGAMTLSAGGASFALYEASPHGSDLWLEAEATPQARTGSATDWPVAAVAIRYDDQHYWHFAIVESPEAQGLRHFVELSEMHAGVWNAQHGEGTSLTTTAHEGSDFDWQYGAVYRLRITLTPAGVSGELWDASGARRTHIAFAFDNTAVTYGQPALRAGGFSVAFDNVAGAVNVEAEGPPAPTFPPYAVPGNDALAGTATGFFHTEQIGGTWWLVDPRGKTFYIVGTDHINYNGHWCAALGYAPYGRNAAEKYGTEAAWAEATAERLAAWGFNTLPAGHSKSLRHRSFAHIEFLSLGTSFSDIDDLCPKTTWTGFPNVFSPKWAAHCSKMARIACTPVKDDPWLIGYFLDNELEWYGKSYQEWGLFDEAWKKPAGHTAKEAWVDFLRAALPGPEALEEHWGVAIASFDALSAHTTPATPQTDFAKAVARDWVRLVARRYFETCRDAIRAADPNHLLLGNRFAGRAPDIWDIAGANSDVVSFNMYPWIDVRHGVPAGVVEQIDTWHAQADKPLMITEWSFPALDSGLPCEHGAGMRVDTQSQKSACAAAFQRLMFDLPYMVGSDYFMYIDEPALGISPTFPEDSNYGLIKEDDSIWPELTGTFTTVNREVYPRHAAAEPVSPPSLEARPSWLRMLPPQLPDTPAQVVRDLGGLRVEGPVDGRAWRVSLDGERLGTFHMLAHQQAPANQWPGSTGAAITAVYENSRVTVVDMVLSHSGEGAVKPFAGGWRFWLPRGGDAWFASQCLWVENTSQETWRLENVFHYLTPVLGGSQEGDGPVTFVPQYFRRGGAWVDATAGLGVGAWAPDGDAFQGSFWKDEGGGFHADFYQPAGVDLAPGERFTPEDSAAFFFAVAPQTLAGYGAAVTRVEDSLTDTCHTADADCDGSFSLSEVLRLVQFYNAGAHHCGAAETGGYAAGPGAQDCPHHMSDYQPPDWRISLSELLRQVQIFQAGSYHACVESASEDGFCPGS